MVFTVVKIVLIASISIFGVYAYFALNRKLTRVTVLFFMYIALMVIFTVYEFGLQNIKLLYFALLMSFFGQVAQIQILSHIHAKRYQNDYANKIMRRILWFEGVQVIGLVVMGAPDWKIA